MEKLAPVTNEEYITLAILCFGCLLIGWFFASIFFKRKMKKALALCESEKQRIKRKQVDFTHNESNLILEQQEEETPSIRAVKTRERNGAIAGTEDDPDPISTVKEVAPIDLTDGPFLNFESFGHATEKEKDDLKQLNGIGPFIEEKLNKIGIYTFEQISKFNTEDMETVTEMIQFFPGRIERDNWVGQAKKLKN